LDRLPDDVLAKTKGLYPDTEDDISIRTEKYTEIEAVVAKHYGDMKAATGGGLQHAGSAHCVLHNKRCTLFEGNGEVNTAGEQLLTVNATGTSCKECINCIIYIVL
jgi:hypothetical protein